MSAYIALPAENHFYKSALHDSLRRIDFHLRKWRRKFKRFKQKPKSAREWLARIIQINPELFAHWPLLREKLGVSLD